MAAERLAARVGQPEIAGIDPQPVQSDSGFRRPHCEIEAGFKCGEIAVKADFEVACAGRAEQQVGPSPRRLDMRLCAGQECNAGVSARLVSTSRYGAARSGEQRDRQIELAAIGDRTERVLAASWPAWRPCWSGK